MARFECIENESALRNGIHWVYNSFQYINNYAIHFINDLNFFLINSHKNINNDYCNHFSEVFNAYYRLYHYMIGLFFNY